MREESENKLIGVTSIKYNNMEQCTQDQTKTPCSTISTSVVEADNICEERKLRDLPKPVNPFNGIENKTFTQENDCNFLKNTKEEKNNIKALSYSQYYNFHNSNIESAVPDSISHLIDGLLIPADPDSKNDFSPPLWFNLEKFKLGQKFAQNYFFCLAYAEMLSLMLLFSFKGGVDPLIFTKKSSSPFTAFRRYLSTVDRVRSWYRSDLCDPTSAGSKNISAVRLLHRSIKQRMNESTTEEIAQRIKIDSSEICCPMLYNLQEDFRKQIPPAKIGQCPPNTSDNKLHVNQFDMALTQFGFVGLIILHPEKFGAINATEKELEGFVHLWAIIGHLLGIQDKFNFCINGLIECRKMSYDLIEYWFKPNLRDVSPEWEHMCRCVVEGISYYVPENSFETSVLYLSWVLNIPVSKVSTTVSWWRKTLFKLQRFLFCVLVRLPGQRAFHNWMLNRRIDRALSASESWLQNKMMRSQAFIRRNNTPGIDYIDKNN